MRSFSFLHEVSERRGSKEIIEIHTSKPCPKCGEYLTLAITVDHSISSRTRKIVPLEVELYCPECGFKEVKK